MSWLTRFFKRSREATDAAETVVVYQHSDLIYWWVVWAYGFLCAILTRIGGEPISISGSKAILIHPGPWVGISFALLAVFVLIATSAKARGIASLVLVLTIPVIAWLVGQIYGWDNLLELLPLLRVHMNLAFYVLVSSSVFAGWFIVTFVVERLTVWKFSAGTITVKKGLMDEEHVFKATSPLLNRLPDDILVNKILGLWFLGFGTGDIEISFNTASGRERHVLRNVWCGTVVAKRIGKLLGQQPVTASQVS